MAPLNEIHRFIDEAHESSLRVGDLLGLLAEPSIPRSKCRRSANRGLSSVNLSSSPTISRRVPRCRRTSETCTERAVELIRHGETIGVAGRSGCGKTTWLRTLMRLAHRKRRRRDPRWRRADIHLAAGLSAIWSVTSARTRSSSPARSPKTSPTAAKQRPMIKFAVPPSARAFTMKSWRCRVATMPGGGTRPESLGRPKAADRPGPHLSQEPADPDSR